MHNSPIVTVADAHAADASDQSDHQAKTSRIRRVFALRQFQGRNNSLNLIRLFLALGVIFHHAYPLTGRVESFLFLGQDSGWWAVFMFFTISGYLITASKYSNSLPVYFAKRAARLFPGYLVVQILIAFVVAPVTYVVEHGRLIGYFSEATTPYGYVIGNASMKINSYNIGSTLASNPYPGAWNGSTWTLWLELLCYIFCGFLIALIARFKKGIQIGVIVGVWLVAALGSGNLKFMSTYFSNGLFDIQWFIRLLAAFMGGSVVYILRKQAKLGVLPALGAVVVVCLLGTFVQPNGLQLAAPFVLYVIMTVATVVPSPRWFKTNDLSYGVYIYAFPVQQFFSFYMMRHGVIYSIPIDILVVTVLTLVCAFGSWKLIEQPALRAVQRL